MTKQLTLPEETLPAAFDADVVVAGGGSAGCAAAIAAARGGADTLLVEQSGCCGGMIARGLLPSIISMTDGKKLMAGGICRELVDRVAADMNFPVDYEWQNIHPESVKFVLDGMLAEAGVRVLFDTTISHAAVEDGAISFVAITRAAGSR